MNTLRYTQIRQIRFIAANYTRLQGLRALPFYLALFAVTFWANLQQGPAPRPFLLPLLLAVGLIALSWPIDRYYKRAFGRVVQDQTLKKELDWVVNIGGGLICLIAFLADAYVHLPFSVLGLALALAILLDYLLIVHFTEYWYMPFWPGFVVLIVLISTLPLFGIDGWWKLLGIKAQILGIVMLTSLVMSFASLISHIYFTRTLPKEVSNGGRI